ncbi:MAG: dethiobiotin synthase [Sporocytophaga sp.]|nr:dethiobiotin synthase [Sporocytophaga sp.]
MNYFVTAINTDSGKTLVSAILTQALQADYWKPIQSGVERDADKVRDLINNNHSLIFNESYWFQTPASPHYAAEVENVTIDLDKILIPGNKGNNLVIEGAGGVLVPLNDTHFVIDLAAKFNAEIILVSNNYLGSINHTLLTINEIKRRGLSIKGIIFNGPRNESTEDFILKHSGLKCLLKIDQEKEIDQFVVNKYAIELFNTWEG